MLTVLEVAKKEGVTVQAVHKWIKEKKIKASRAGFFWVIEDDYEVKGKRRNRNG